jgi:tryptophan synthase alpha subunit
MNRLNELFERKKEPILSIYFTAGYPELNSTLDIAEALEKAGADFLEIGFRRTCYPAKLPKSFGERDDFEGVI